MRVKVTANLTIGYGGEYHGNGDEFSILPDDLPQLAGLVAIVTETPEPAIEPAAVDTTELTIAEIKTILDGHGIEYSKRARRAELLAMLPE